jgi:hypothetical protein
MSVPLSQMYTVASYILRQKLSGRKRYPFVLMLEPLFRCNLACAGCGKIQYPAHILRKHLTVERCLAAVARRRRGGWLRGSAGSTSPACGTSPARRPAAIPSSAGKLAGVCAWITRSSSAPAGIRIHQHRRWR